MARLMMVILYLLATLTACVATPQLQAKHGNTLFSLNKPAPKVLNLSVSPDMQLVAAYTRGDTIVLWDLATAAMIGSLHDKSKYPSDYTYLISFSPDNKRLLIGGNYGLVSLALSSLPEKQVLEEREMGGIAWSPDGKKILTIGYDPALLSKGFEPTCTIVKDWSSNTITDTFQDCTELIHHEDRWANIVVSSDGKFAVTANPYTLFLTDISTGKRVNELSFLHKKNERNPYVSHASSWLEFSPDGQKIAMLCNIDKDIHIYELPSFKLVKSIETIADIFEWPKHMPTKFQYSPDGRTIITGGREDGKIIYWDTESGAKIKAIHAHNSASLINSVTGFQLSQNGRFLVSGGDASIKIWDYAKGEEVATFIRFEDDEWLVMTPDGYYNASPRGDQYLSVTDAGKPVPTEQLRSKYYRPDAVKQALKALTTNPGETSVLGSSTDETKAKNQ